MTTNRILLFSYDDPKPLNYILNADPGIWFLNLSPGNIVVTDDNSNTGYYSYENETLFQIESASVDGLSLAKVDSLADCRTVDASFFYDQTTYNLYIHFAGFEPPHGKTIYFGVAIGYANRTQSDGTSYYSDYYYDPRITNIQNIKKSVDPLFFGVLKYQGGKITLINDDGEFDDWRSRNLFGQATRILYGDDGDAYADFVRVHSGFIENDSRDFDNLQITVADVRKALTQPVARNTFSLATYPDLSPDDVDKAKPVIYGSVKNAPTTCLNAEETGSPDRVFLFMDTEFNQASSVTVYADGVEVVNPALVSVDYSTGTFTTTNAAQADKEITVDVVTPIANGAEIIKDLMYRYDGKNYIASFWDLTETAAAVALARDTSVYIDNKDKKLYNVLEAVCFDIDARFFAHDTGKYTIRIYDENRTPTRTIYADEWLSDADISNNGNEYLTSAVIKFNHDIGADTWQQVEYKDFEAAAFARYKKYKVDTFETNLTDEASAIEKADTIMRFSSNVQDIISRSIPLVNNDLEIADFVICDPLIRPLGTEARAIYEILGLEKDLEKEQIKLTLRYVKADPTAALTYGARITTDGDYRIDADGNTRTYTEESA